MKPQFALNLNEMNDSGQVSGIKGNTKRLV